MAITKPAFFLICLGCLLVFAWAIVGQALQRHLHITAIIFGWGIFSFGVMTMSVAVTAYALDSYPTAPAELVAGSTSRVPLAVSVSDTSSRHGEQRVGAAASFGTQSAVVAVAAVPVLLVHIYGHGMRKRFGQIK
ncbi:hypothetical protein QQZ08_004638 [Neonectria magnoliae]|uniref:Uncharacterized protein n=1 Tax=Neonectria magnoliae TaxID=2732573 RepID=A0ABR1I7N4_9HYPO